MTQRDSRSGRHGQRGQQSSAETTDSYKILASAPEITPANLSSTERQWTLATLIIGIRRGDRRHLANGPQTGPDAFARRLLVGVRHPARDTESHSSPHEDGKEGMR
jgi:hypothetical protein